MHEFVIAFANFWIFFADVSYRYMVDMYFCGHMHMYER